MAGAVMRVALIAFLMLAGCGQTKYVTRVETVEVIRQQLIPLDPDLLRVCYAPEWPRRSLDGEDADRWIIAAQASFRAARVALDEALRLQQEGAWSIQE